MLMDKLICVFLRSRPVLSILCSPCNTVCFTISKCEPSHYLIMKTHRQLTTTPASFKSKNRGKTKTKHSQTQVDTLEIDSILDVNELMEEFDREIMQMKNEFTKHLSLRTSVGSLESLTINYKGNTYRIDELAKVSRRPKEVMLDLTTNADVIPKIYSLLSSTEMRLNPIKTGHCIQIAIPKVTKEYRETLAKNAKMVFNKYSDNIKRVKHSNIKTVKEIKNIPLDQCRRVEANIDALSKQYIKKAESILNEKVKELLHSQN